MADVIYALGVPAVAAASMQMSLAAGMPAPGAVLIGLINGFGGGFLRDITVGNTPGILRLGRFNLSAGFFACGLFVLPEPHRFVSPTVAAWTIIVLFFTIRALAVRHDWRTRSVLPPGDEP